MIYALDHINIAVKDIEAARAQYESLLGRKPSWESDGGGVRQAWFQFPNMALNILAHTGPGVWGDTVKARLDGAGEGLYAIAFATRELETTCRLFERRGVPVSSPTRLRAKNSATGETRLWTVAVGSAAAAHGMPFFFVEHREGEADWQLSPPLEDEASAVSELDHVVINTPDPERAVAFYGGRLGLDLRLDRSNLQLGNRLLFFKLGTAIIEIGARLGPGSTGPDRFGGLAWRVRKPELVRARLVRAGFDVSEVRQGRKPGTAVFTVRDKTCSVPTIMIEQGDAGEGA